MTDPAVLDLDGLTEPLHRQREADGSAASIIGATLDAMRAQFPGAGA